MGGCVGGGDASLSPLGQQVTFLFSHCVGSHSPAGSVPGWRLNAASPILILQTLLSVQKDNILRAGSPRHPPRLSHSS